MDPVVMVSVPEAAGLAAWTTIDPLTLALQIPDISHGYCVVAATAAVDACAVLPAVYIQVVLTPVRPVDIDTRNAANVGDAGNVINILNVTAVVLPDH
jgi:hypothetical protein